MALLGRPRLGPRQGLPTVVTPMLLESLDQKKKTVWPMSSPATTRPMPPASPASTACRTICPHAPRLNPGAAKGIDIETDQLAALSADLTGLWTTPRRCPRLPPSAASTSTMKKRWHGAGFDYPATRSSIWAAARSTADPATAARLLASVDKFRPLEPVPQDHVHDQVISTCSSTFPGRYSNEASVGGQTSTTQTDQSRRAPGALRATASPRSLIHTEGLTRWPPPGPLVSRGFPMFSTVSPATRAA